MVLTTKLFDALGLSRDSVSLFWTKWCAFILALAAMGTDITKVGIPERYAPYIAGIALFISVSSAQHRTSDLPGENDGYRVSPPKASIWILAMLLGGGLLGAGVVTSSCASLPLKQKAVVSLQASETALEAAHDAERALCAPTADQAQAITHCDGAQAIAIGLTDARHQALATLFARAFDAELRAATALKAWRAGDPAPASLTDYQQVINQILALVEQEIPSAAAVAAKAQDAVNQAAQLAATLGVK